jgi:large subunit ribosomal protein L5e
MGFVKNIKNRAYHSRIQTKPLRRRQGKTDYFARHRLVLQAKNKYASKKYRLVVRRTNKRFICQVIYSNMNGDVVMCSADSQELRRYGLTAGLTNYSAAYCTGLLVARRLLKQVGLADMYKPNSKIDGEFHEIEVQDKRAFKVLLDVGIHRTTTGARVFGVMKGASDGGLNVPHSTKRFPGYSRAKVEEVINKRGKATGETERQEAKFEAGKHRERIFGNHVFNYMTQLKKEDKDKFTRQFRLWEKCLADSKTKSCEELYKKVHAAILANSDRQKKAARKPVVKVSKTLEEGKIYENSKGKKWFRHKKMTGDQRKQRVVTKLQSMMS